MPRKPNVEWEHPRLFDITRFASVAADCKDGSTASTPEVRLPAVVMAASFHRATISAFMETRRHRDRERVIRARVVVQH